MQVSAVVNNFLNSNFSPAMFFFSFALHNVLGLKIFLLAISQLFLPAKGLAHEITWPLMSPGGEWESLLTT